MSVRDAITLTPGADPVEVRDGTADVFYVDAHGLIVPVASVDAGAVVLAASEHAQLRVVPRIDAVIAATPSAADDVAGIQAFVAALAGAIGPGLAAPLESCDAADVPGVLADLLPWYVEQQKTEHARTPRTRHPGRRRPARARVPPGRTGHHASGRGARPFESRPACCGARSHRRRAGLHRARAGREHA